LQLVPNQSFLAIKVLTDFHLRWPVPKYRQVTDFQSILPAVFKAYMTSAGFGIYLVLGEGPVSVAAI
jgi:hypothetical protein